MEIYSLKITLPNRYLATEWYRIIEVPEDFDLDDLHYFIQQVVDFDNDHLYDFYLAKNYQIRGKELITEDIKLNQLYPLKGKQLFYLFDYGDTWLFQINKSRKKLSTNDPNSYPKLVESVGKNPEQYPSWDDEDDDE